MNIKLGPRQSLHQLTQALNVRFAWANKEGDTFVGLTQAARCKEYITDMILWHQNGKYGDVFGMKYNPDFREDPYMLLQFPNKLALDNLKSNMYLFASLGWPTTIVAEQAKTIVVELDREWMRTSWRLSLWSVMIKLFCHQANKTLDNFWVGPHNEQTQIGASEMRCEGLLDFIIRNLRGLPVYPEFCRFNDDMATPKNYAGHPIERFTDCQHMDRHGAAGFFNHINACAYIKHDFKKEVVAMFNSSKAFKAAA